LNPKLLNAVLIPEPLFQNRLSKFEQSSEKGLMYFLIENGKNDSSSSAAKKWWSSEFKSGKSNSKHLFWKFDGY